MRIRNGQKEYPKTLREAVERLLSLKSEEDKEELKNIPVRDLIKFHFSMGIMIMDECGLWKGNGTLIRSCCSDTFLTHPDDASVTVLKAVWKTL